VAALPKVGSVGRVERRARRPPGAARVASMPWVLHQDAPVLHKGVLPWQGLLQEKARALRSASASLGTAVLSCID
jgi:hypothetical protein